MTFHVYILYSHRLDRFYVGQTIQLDKRIAQHNNGEAGYTSVGIPWTLLWSTAKPSLTAAEKLERKIKNLSRVRKLRFVTKYAEGIKNQELFEWLNLKR